MIKPAKMNIKDHVTRRILLPVCLIVGTLMGCRTEEMPKESMNAKGQVLELPPVKVAVQEIEEVDFYLELVSNGKLEAVSKADMRFRLSEQIEIIYVQNGQMVKKGQLLATLDDFEQLTKLKQSEVNLENARISLVDYLINQGYDWGDSALIPREIMDIAKVKSGYQAAKHSFDLARHNLSLCELRASQSGEIANLNSKEHSYPKSGEPFCMIIDRTEMEIRFPIMEPEASMVKVGQQVSVLPYYQEEEVKGVVASINPMIDENGLIEVMARVSNRDKRLLEGMNAKVFARKNIGKRMAVPKEAVTLRSERPVVFVYKDGRALWNYVKTAEENSSHVVVSSENTPFKVGDQVIVDGNLHLAHESRVELN